MKNGDLKLKNFPNLWKSGSKFYYFEKNGLNSTAGWNRGSKPWSLCTNLINGLATLCFSPTTQTHWPLRHSPTNVIDKPFHIALIYPTLIYVELCQHPFTKSNKVTFRYTLQYSFSIYWWTPVLYCWSTNLIQKQHPVMECWLPTMGENLVTSCGTFSILKWGWVL